MDGILIIDKPDGITSHDVVARVRRILKTKRVGHTGTLDPFATGVMVILVGQATRLARFLDKDEKEYEALVSFGFETDTGDRTGSPKSRVQSPRPLRVDELRSVLDDFRGEIMQVPPMYSAKKVDGKKLYELARKGEVIERHAVAVNIRELALSELPASEGGTNSVIETATLRVTCSAGTYIRTLAEDIGQKLGTGAHLSELRRPRSGKFTIEQSLNLEQLENLDDPASALISMNEAISHLAKFTVPNDRLDKTKNGLSTRIFDSAFEDGEPIQMIDTAGSMLAVGFFDSAENVVQPKVVLV